MNPAKTGISRLLIASAIDPDVYRRLLESPEETFDEFDLADEDRELLRHPDHRLLRVLGAALAEENPPASAAAGVATTAAPPAVAGAPLAGATRAGGHGSIQTRRLMAGWDDDSLLTVLRGIPAN